MSKTKIKKKDLLRAIQDLEVENLNLKEKLNQLDLDLKKRTHIMESYYLYCQLDELIVNITKINNLNFERPSTQPFIFFDRKNFTIKEVEKHINKVFNKEE